MPELFKSYAINLTSTAQATLLSAATGTAVINAINITNVNTSGTATISVVLTRATNTFTIIKNSSVQSQGTVQILDRAIPIGTGDAIKVQQGSTAGSFDVIASVLEIT